VVAVVVVVVVIAVAVAVVVTESSEGNIFEESFIEVVF